MVSMFFLYCNFYTPWSFGYYKEQTEEIRKGKSEQIKSVYSKHLLLKYLSNPVDWKWEIFYCVLSQWDFSHFWFSVLSLYSITIIYFQLIVLSAED